jgi:hypothetical protein
MNIGAETMHLSQHDIAGVSWHRRHKRVGANVTSPHQKQRQTMSEARLETMAA